MKLLRALAFIFTMTTAASFAADGPIRHVVHFKFKPDADPAAVRKVVEEFSYLPARIKQVQSFEYGTDISPEGFGQGYTHCWVIGFKDAKDRDAYLVHPEHKKFVEIAVPVIETPLVVDFVVKGPGVPPKAVEAKPTKEKAAPASGKKTESKAPRVR